TPMTPEVEDDYLAAIVAQPHHRPEDVLPLDSRRLASQGEVAEFRQLSLRNLARRLVDVVGQPDLWIPLNHLLEEPCRLLSQLVEVPFLQLLQVRRQPLGDGLIPGE